MKLSPLVEGEETGSKEDIDRNSKSKEKFWSKYFDRNILIEIFWSKYFDRQILIESVKMWSIDNRQ